MSLGRMEINTFRKAEKITKITHISCKLTKKKYAKNYDTDTLILLLWSAGTDTFTECLITAVPISTENPVPIDHYIVLIATH